MEKPRFSIITPLYKSELYLEGLVASVQAQNVADWELLLVDDCSPDGTFAMASEYAKDDPRIQVLKTEKNFGAPAGPRNVGLRAACGEFVTFLDHDDPILQQKLSRCYEIMLELKLDFLCTNGELLNASTGKVDGNAVGTVMGSSEEIIANFSRRLLEGNFVFPNSTLIRRSVFERVGLFDETLRGVDDFDMWYRISREFRCGFSNEVLATWRYKNSASISADDTKMVDDERRFYAKYSSQNPLAAEGEKRAYMRLGNRYLLKRQYYEAAENYDLAEKMMLALFARTMGPLFRLAYLLKRRMGEGNEFSPLVLDFRNK